MCRNNSSQSSQVPDHLRSTKIDVDPLEAQSFLDLKVEPVIVNALMKAYPEVNKPTVIQKKMLALLKSDLSVIASSQPGSGKSLATVLYLLSHPQAKSDEDESFITNLILVPTPDLAVEYYEKFQRLLKHSPLNIHQVVQHIYRTNSQRESDQLNLLQEFQGPHTLIATPTRMLDILSSTGAKDKVHIEKLSCIVIDEADLLLPKKKYSRHNASRVSVKSGRHYRSPTDILMSYIYSRRKDYIQKISRIYSPLRLILQASSPIDYLSDMVHSPVWMEERSALNIGSKSLALANHTDVFCVTYNSSTDSISDTKIKIIDTDNVDKEQVLAFLKRTKDYVAWSEGTLKLYCKAFLEMFNAERRTKGVLIIPHNVSVQRVAKILTEHGLISASSRLSDGGDRLELTSSQTNSTNLDPETIFSDNSPNSPDVLLYDRMSIRGLNFPNLSHVYALGWDSVGSSEALINLAGSSRPKNRGKLIVINAVSGEKSPDNHKMSLDLANLQIAPKKYNTA